MLFRFYFVEDNLDAIWNLYASSIHAVLFFHFYFQMTKRTSDRILKKLANEANLINRKEFMPINAHTHNVSSMREVNVERVANNAQTTKMDKLTKRNGQLKDKIAQLEGEIVQLKKKNDELDERLKNDIDSLKKELNQILSQYSRNGKSQN